MIAKFKSPIVAGFAANTAMAVTVGFFAHTAMGSEAALVSMAGQAQVLASSIIAVIAVPPLLACQMGVSAVWKRVRRSV